MFPDVIPKESFLWYSSMFKYMYFVILFGEILIISTQLFLFILISKVTFQ